MFQFSFFTDQLILPQGIVKKAKVWLHWKLEMTKYFLSTKRQAWGIRIRATMDINF